MNESDYVPAITKTYIFGITSSLSLGGALYMIAYILNRWRKYGRDDLSEYSNTFLLFLAISNATSAVWYLFAIILADDESISVCKAVAFFGTILELSSALWISSMGLAIFINLQKSQKFQSSLKKLIRSLRRQLISYALLSWGLPIVCGFIFLFADQLGYNGYWCWIKKGEESQLFYFYYLPIIILFWGNCLLFGIVYYRKRTLHIPHIDLMAYLPCAIFTWLFPTVYHSLLEFGHQVYLVELLSNIFLPLQGFSYALVFCYMLWKENRVENLSTGGLEERIVLTGTGGVAQMRLFGTTIQFFMEENDSLTNEKNEKPEL